MAVETRPQPAQSDATNQYGYRQFSLGEFTFKRDEYFAYVTWPTGHHVMSVDGFLRSLQRDVAWQFFYGIVNFDGVIGTVNHYGTFDPFASPTETGSAFGPKNGDNTAAVTRRRVTAQRMVGVPGDEALRSD